MDFNEAVETALKTWYPKDHDLHLNPHHPLGKLLGEWGELLDDYMKSLYKPGYVFEPEDELGDIWYYVRILCYQKGYEPKPTKLLPFVGFDKLIAIAMLSTAWLFLFGFPCKFVLNVSYTALSRVAILDDLTASNWEKLKPGSVRGDEWQGAGKIETDYKGGKIGLK